MQCGNVIHTGDYFRTNRNNDDRTRSVCVGANAADNFHAHSENFPVGGERNLSMIDLVAAVVAGQKLLAARRAPMHRALELARSIGTNTVFSVELGLHTKAATNVTYAYPHFFFRNFQNGIR